MADRIWNQRTQTFVFEAVRERYGPFRDWPEGGLTYQYTPGLEEWLECVAKACGANSADAVMMRICFAFDIWQKKLDWKKGARSKNGPTGQIANRMTIAVDAMRAELMTKSEMAALLTEQLSE